jgi:hypothetical protein
MICYDIEENAPLFNGSIFTQVEALSERRYAGISSLGSDDGPSGKTPVAFFTQITSSSLKSYRSLIRLFIISSGTRPGMVSCPFSH